MLDADGVWRPASGKVWVIVEGTQGAGADAGDRLRVTGKLRAVGPPENPGEDDMRLMAAQGSWAGVLAVEDESLISRLPGDERTWSDRARAGLLAWRGAMVARAAGVIDHACEDDADGKRRSLIGGLVLGAYDPAFREEREAFARLGLAHVLSISGFHLSVMAGLVLVLLRITGDHGRLEAILVTTLLVAYVVIVPPTSPVLRSAAMVFLLLAGELAGRRYDRLTLLAWIAVALLVWRPLDLWDLGFQLSVGLTAMLLWNAEHFAARLVRPALRGEILPRGRAFLRRLREGARLTVATALMCWLVSMPLLLRQVGTLSALGVVATLVVTPAVVVILWIAYAALMAGMVVPAMAAPASWVLKLLASGVIASVHALDSLPGSSLALPPVSPAWTGVATVLLLGWVRWWNPRDWRAVCATMIVILWGVVAGLTTGRVDRAVALRLDSFSVGDASCHLIRSGGDVLLWDAGWRSGSSGMRHELVRGVRALGVGSVPTVVITHPDLDHFRALPDIVRALGVRRVITDELFIAQARARAGSAPGVALRSLESMGVTVETALEGDEIRAGAIVGRVLSPPDGAPWKADNDHSLVVFFTAGDETPGLLMTGDIQDDAIAHVETHLDDLKHWGGVGVLELPHHGSVRPGARRLVEELDPRIIVQSGSRTRVLDDRWDDLRAGREWLGTGALGAVEIDLMRDGTLRGRPVR